MEGEERDAERKGDIGLRQRQSERRQQRREIAGDEIGIFEHREDEKISRHRDGERNWRAAPSRSSMISAAKKLKTIENKRTRMKRGSPQA